jgi:hypothetical protein
MQMDSECIEVDVIGVFETVETVETLMMYSEKLEGKMRGFRAFAWACVILYRSGLSCSETC